ncbi:hypothetical protein [Pseudomonas sp. ML2-2023-6]|uniref:hypothetical protein n=1 Tax=Pseudomonas sp. ML2-2023-6 TaxID=3122376 RepID=UPI0030D30E34
MSTIYIVQKVPVVFHVQGSRLGRNTTSEPIAGFHWVIREAVSGKQIGDPYNEQQRAEDACLELNTPQQ